MKKVKAITIKNGKTVFNLASSSANDDWIRAGRLLAEGKADEVKKLDETPMYYRDKSLLIPFRKNKSK